MSTQIVGVDEKNLRAYFAPMSPEQSRAARAWLDWSQEELAAKASVSLSTVRDFEKARRVPIANNLMQCELPWKRLESCSLTAHRPASPFQSANGAEVWWTGWGLDPDSQDGRPANGTGPGPSGPVSHNLA